MGEQARLFSRDLVPELRESGRVTIMQVGRLQNT